MKSQKRSAPTTNDLIKMTKYEFDTAGNDIEPITVKNEAQAAKEINFLATKIQEGVEWDEQVDAIKRGIGLVNGGILEYDVFVSNLIKIKDGLILGAYNLRSALVKMSCIFLTQLVQHLQSKFSIFGDVISPLSRQTSHGTFIIAESCKLTIHQIAKNCQKKSTLFAIINLSKSKAFENRQICSDSFILMLQFWGHKIIKNNSDVFMKTLRLLLTDSQLQVRLTSRIAANMFASKFQEFSEVFLATLDPKTRKAVMEAVVPKDTPPIQDQTSPVKSPTKKRPISPQKEQTSLNVRNNKAGKVEKRSKSVKESKLSATIKKEEEKTKRKSNIPIVSKEEPIYSELENTKTSAKRRGKSERPTFKPKAEKIDPIRKPKKVENNEIGSPILVKDKRNFLVSSPPMHKYTKRKSAPQINERVKVESKKNTIKRQSTPAQFSKDQQLTNAIFMLEDGSENAFLSKIEEYIKKSKTKELKSCLTGIFPGLIKCSAGKDTKISDKALRILSDLIPKFPKEFFTHLLSLLDVIFGGILDITEENENSIDSILSSLIKCYDQYEILGFSIAQIPSVKLAHFIAEIVNQKDLNYIKINTVQKMLKLAFSQAKSNREDSIIILEFINSNYPQLITSIESTLRSEELELVNEIKHKSYERIEDHQQTVAKGIIMPQPIQKGETRYQIDQKEEVKQQNVEEKEVKQQSVEEREVKQQNVEEKEVKQQSIDEKEDKASIKEDRYFVPQFVDYNEIETEFIDDKKVSPQNVNVKDVKEEKEIKEIEIPQFDNNNEIYCTSIRRIINELNDEKWFSVRESLYKSIVEAIGKSDSPDAIFGLILEIFEMKGIDSYELLLRSLIVCDKPKKLHNRSKVLKFIADKATAQSLIKSFTDPCSGEDYEFTYKLLDELKLIVETHKEKIKKEANHATEIVADYINSPSLHVRKSVVFLIVTLISQYGEEAEKATEKLELSKKRLISIYIEKLKC